MQEAGQWFTQGPGLQGHGLREEEDLLRRHPTELASTSVTKYSAGVTGTCVLTEVDLASDTELTTVTREVGVYAYPVPWLVPGTLTSLSAA